MNIFEAIKARDSQAFLSILDKGFKRAAKRAAAESRKLGLTVVDGHAAEKQCDEGQAQGQGKRRGG